MVDTDANGAKQGLRRRNFWVNDLQVDGVESGSYANYQYISGAQANLQNATIGSFINPITIFDATANSGFFITNIPAETIISGGQWVTGSAASGTTPTLVCKTAAANQQNPLGICMATTQSGAFPTIMVKGYYQGLIAEATVTAGQPICAGSGAAINTILPSTAVGTMKGQAIMGAGSAGIVSVYLW